MVGWLFRNGKNLYGHLYHFRSGNLHIFGAATIEKNQQLKISAYPYYFTFILILGLIALFFGHSYILERGDFDAAGLQLVKSYVLSAIMAAIVFFTIYLFRNKYRDLLGFFFGW